MGGSSARISKNVEGGINIEKGFFSMLIPFLRGGGCHM